MLVVMVTMFMVVIIDTKSSQGNGTKMPHDDTKRSQGNSTKMPVVDIQTKQQQL